jgi:LuxR family transcriptional regulator, quorum-sensing system regulator CviR
MKNRKNISNKDFKTLLDLIHLSFSCDNEIALKNFILNLSKFLPYNYATCVFGNIDNKGMKIPYHHLNINYPEEWSKIYAEKELHFVDPIFKEHFAAFQLQYWQDTYKKHQTPKSFLSISQDFGLLKGYTHGVRNITNTKGSLISISGDDIERNPRTEYILHNLIPCIHLMLERVVRQNKKRRHCRKLSPREKEVLTWISQGKTDWEISVILGISVKTVNLYVTTLMAKLDAVTRTHATAIALDLGIIELD